MPQEELAARSDFEIVNDGVRDVEEQVVNLLNHLDYLKIKETYKK